MTPSAGAFVSALSSSKASGSCEDAASKSCETGAKKGLCISQAEDFKVLLGPTDGVSGLSIKG
jgi:hypothetical protein